MKRTSCIFTEGSLNLSNAMNVFIVAVPYALLPLGLFNIQKSAERFALFLFPLVSSLCAKLG